MPPLLAADLSSLSETSFVDLLSLRYDSPHPPPPGLSIRIRSPLRKRALNFPGRVCFEPSARRICALPTAPLAPPVNPHGGYSRRSANNVASASVRTSISRTTPSPPRNLPGSPASETQPVLTDAQGIGVLEGLGGRVQGICHVRVHTARRHLLLGRAPMPPAMVS